MVILLLYHSEAVVVIVSWCYVVLLFVLIGDMLETWNHESDQA